MHNRLVVVQGPLQLLQAITVLEHLSKQSPSQGMDALLLGGMGVFGADREKLYGVCRRIAQLWPFARVEEAPEDRRSCTPDEWARETSLLASRFALESPDQILVCRNWQFVNEVALGAFPLAKKMVYGDGYGQLDYLPKGASSPNCPAGLSDIDEAFAVFPGFANDHVVDRPWTQVDSGVLDGVLRRAADLFPELDDVAAKLDLRVGRNATLVLTNYCTEAYGIVDHELELDAVMDVVLAATIPGERIVIKGHPRQRFGLSSRVCDRLAKAGRDVCLLDDLLQVPIELLLCRWKPARAFPFASYSSVVLAWIARCELHVGFGRKALSRLFSDERLIRFLSSEETLSVASRKLLAGIPEPVVYHDRGIQGQFHELPIRITPDGSACAERYQFTYRSSLSPRIQDVAANVRRLHLGSGHKRMFGYLDVDAYVHAQGILPVSHVELPHQTSSVDEILSEHSLEHIGKYEVPLALAEWARVLRPGGRLFMNLPNLEWCMKAWLSTPEEHRWGWQLDTIFGLQDHPGEYHKTGFTAPRLRQLLADAGFTQMRIDDYWSHGQGCFWVEAVRDDALRDPVEGRAHQGLGIGDLDRSGFGPVNPATGAAMFGMEASFVVPACRGTNQLRLRFDLELPSEGLGVGQVFEIELHGERREIRLDASNPKGVVSLDVAAPRGDVRISIRCTRPNTRIDELEIGGILGRLRILASSEADRQPLEIDPGLEDILLKSLLLHLGGDASAARRRFAPGAVLPGGFRLEKAFLLLQTASPEAALWELDGLGSSLAIDLLRALSLGASGKVAQAELLLGAFDVSSGLAARVAASVRVRLAAWSGDWKKVSALLESFRGEWTTQDQFLYALVHLVAGDVSEAREIVETMDPSTFDAAAARNWFDALLSTGHILEARAWLGFLMQKAPENRFEWRIRALAMDASETCDLQAEPFVELDEVSAMLKNAIEARRRGDLAEERRILLEAKVSIVIPVHGHLDLTRQCVEHVRSTTNPASTEIVVVDDASPDTTAEWMREQQAAGAIKAVFLSPNRGFAGACNAGAAASEGEFVVFLNNDTIVRPGWLQALLAPLANDPNIGLTGARLLYPEGDIQHAGIRLHPNGLPDHEFRHLPAEDPQVTVSRDRAFVTGACIGLRKDLFRKIGCFDDEFKMYVEDLDLCLKVWNEGLRVRYVAECVVVHLESRTTPDLEKRTALVKTGMERLFSRWMGRWPEGLFALPDWPANFRNTLANPAGASEAPALHAFAPALNFTGYARLNREAFLALEEAGTLRLSLDPSVNNAEFIKGLEAQGEAATAPWNRIVSREPDHSGFCLISDLPCNFAKLRAARPAFAGYAGLTMFETDRLPAGWKDDCLGVDEIWVPSSFNLRSFAAAGVPERMLKRIPCGIDMDRFRPGAAAPLRVEGRRRTNFLSVFEWTPRKGWDVLLLGWANAFSRDDDASLTLKAYIADSRPGELAAKIESFYRSRGIDSASLAPIIVVDGFLPEAAMPGLYASADVFALPSRGEGWGLPYLESMASGVPVIATGWSAHLDFVTSENGYLVDHELVPVSKEQTTLSSYYGADHRWADPSVDHFADLLRRCHRDRDEVRAKGARARIEVQEAYSARRTAEWISEQARGNGAKRPTATVSESVTPPVAPSLPRLGFDARTLSVPDSIVRGIGNYAWHHLLAILETRPGCDITILHDDAIQPPMEIVERTKALGAKWAPWSSRTASDFDIFHTPDPMHVYPGYPSPFQRYGSTRVTATFYDIIPIRMYEGRISNWPGYLARLDEIGACGATLLCISEFTRKDLLSATSIAPDKAITVMAGFNASSSGRTWTRQEGDALLRRLGIDKPFFLHVGAADPHKNFESALAACQALGKSRPVQFVVAGKLANALGAMRDQIVQAGLKDVVFTDYLTREELELLYSRAVATLFLSRYEGFGFPALEAMACGCPVIASNAASIPEVVGDAALVHGPDDLPGIASSMVRLLDTPALRDDLVRRGRERASRFDWKDVARRTWDAWDRIMSGPSPIPAPPPAPARVRWLSPVWDPSGYGDESRAFVRHLAATDLGANLLAWGRHSESFRQEATPEDRRLLDGLMGREFEPGSPVVLDIPAHAMGRLPGAGHHVGRTTFETDGLPSEWVARCNAMDEIWVPCAFNRETFAKAGVTKPILVVPEGVDTSKFRPGLAPLDLPGPRKAVTYLAVFEWTHRKAPDLLIQAWATAFTSADDVRLVLRTYPPNQIEGDPIAWVESRIDEELARVGKRRADCAPISAIARQVPDADMPGLYAAADVYLAPSRGEGWGRPHMEAMSCGLPVVATRWSGNLDFQTDNNSWLIEIDGLEEIDAREEFPFYRGQKWAKPSLADFVRILRISRDDQDLRRAKGERARRDMMQKWDWSKIAPLAETRIREILEGVPAERSSLLARSAIRQDVSPRNPSPSSRSIPGSSAPIRWAGPVFNYSGYARLARETLKGLMDAGVPVSCDPQLSDNAFFASLSGKNAEISRWKSLLATEPVPGPLVICDLPRDANGGDILGALQRDNPGCGKRIAWTMFETDRLPEGWASALNTLDEVWVPSRFNRETFAAAGVMGSKLHVVPGCIDATPYAQAHPMTLPGSGYAFLSVFQWIERKGYDVLLDAWAKAFKPTDPVRLVLRCHPFGDAPPVEEQLEAFLSLRGLRRRDLAPIHVLDSFLPDAEMPSLFAACDCFVLPSRGEGWGLPYLEAMASAKPVIGTAWSAQTEFLTTDNSWLLSPHAPVPVTMTENGKATFLDPSHRWADPDPTELARLLRHAFDHQEEGRAKGLRGSEDARSLWTPARTAAAIAARLSAGSAAPGKDIHRPAPPSPPADASISTKVSSALAKVAEGIRTTSHPATSARKVESIDPTTPSAKLSIRWEGSQFVHHSLAHVNRELCLRLARNGHALSLIPFEPDQFAPGDDPDLSLLARLHNAPLDKACQIHVRHQWPPNLEAPAHGNWVVIQPWEFGSPPKQWISAFADRLDDLWVPSSYCRDLYVDGGMPADRVHVVPNGVDCNRFRPGLAPYALATKKTFKFLYVGGTIARKGFDTLLNAWKEAFGPDDDVCLVVKDMGGGTFYKGQTAKAWIREMQESRKCAEIEYLDGDMEPNQIPSLYAACDVLVHPYRGEGFGLPIAEAMACGLPCVVTRGGAADDFCGETESWGVQAKRVPVPGGKVGPFETVSPPWWLEPSVPDLVEKLRIAKTDHEARRSKGDAARRRIVEGFTWDKAAAIAEERLLEIASRPPRRSASGPRFVSALDKLSLRITNPGGKLAPAASPALPGTGVADGEIDLAELNRLLVRAEAAAARGELGEAEHLTEDAVARFPHQNLAWLARAMVLRGLGKFRKASEAIDRAIKERETPEALLESLQIHLLAGDAAPARKIEKALKERHAAWFKETRELFRTRGQTWPPDLLKPARAANKPAPPTRKGKR